MAMRRTGRQARRHFNGRCFRSQGRQVAGRWPPGGL